MRKIQVCIRYEEENAFLNASNIVDYWELLYKNSIISKTTVQKFWKKKGFQLKSLSPA